MHVLSKTPNEYFGPKITISACAFCGKSLMLSTASLPPQTIRASANNENDFETSVSLELKLTRMILFNILRPLYMRFLYLIFILPNAVRKARMYALCSVGIFTMLV